MLAEAEREGFSVMLTADKNIRKQQRMEGRSISLLVLRAPNSKLKTHLQMIPEVEQALPVLQPGQILELFHPDLKP
ncbi:MAG: hypothetical protein SF097_17355 [Acidobacteriota bacterium]|nr:hypothetical protein [Acidobacteriota bacterium]